MCDVDRRRRRRRAGRAVDLRHPQGAAPRGPRRLRGAPARPAVPRRRLDGVGRPARAGPPPRRDGDGSRSSASTSTCPTPTCRSPRRCGRAGSRTGPGSRSAGCQSDDCAHPGRRRGRARRGGRRARPGRVRRARHRGQDRRDPVRPHPRHPDARACASACSAWSSRRPGTSPGSTAPTPPSSTAHAPHPVISTMADQVDVVAGERDMGGTMRLGAYPALLADGLGGRGGLRRARDLRAAPAPLRGQQRLPRPAGRRRPA